MIKEKKMSSTYTLNISNEVKYHFYDLMKHVDHTDEIIIIEAVKKALKKHQSMDNAHYLNQRIEKVANMLTMILDKQWSLTKDHKDHMLTALKYFSENNDIIPDDIPVIGYLDDCIVIDLVTEKVLDELKQYQQFSKTIKTYDLCDAENQVDLWHNVKRQELSSRIRHRRRKRTLKRNINSRIHFI